MRPRPTPTVMFAPVIIGSHTSQAWTLKSANGHDVTNTSKVYKVRIIRPPINVSIFHVLQWPHSISSQEQESKKEQEYNLQNNNIAPAAVIPEDQAPAKDFQDPPVPLGKPLAPNFDFDNPSANASFVVRVKPRSARDPYSKRKAQFERKLKLDSIDETDAGSGTSSEATPRTSARFSSGSEDDWGESSTREIQAEINIVPERLDSLTERVESAKVSDEPESPGLFPEGLSDFPEVSESPYRESLERHDPPERPETSERHESSERPKSSERPRSREVTEHLEDPNILDRMDSPLLPEEHGSHDSSFNSLERQRADSPDFNELSDNDETEPDDIIIMGRQRSTSPESIEAPILESQESSSATDSPRNSLEVINRSDPIATDRPTHRAKPSRYDDSDARKDKDLTREERAEALRTKVINMGNRTRMDMGFSDVKDVGVGTRKDFGINTDTDVSIEASIEAVTDLFNDALGEKVMATQTGDSLRLTSDRTTLISSALSQVYVVDSQVGPDGPPFYVNGHNGLINDNKTDSEIGTITEDTVGLASTPPHTKKRSDRMWMCIIAVLTMVILGIIASGIAIYFAGLYFPNSPSLPHIYPNAGI